MIAWKKEELENTFAAAQIETWKAEGQMDGAEATALNEALQPRYRSNPIFIRIGVFLLTLVIASSALGIFGLMIGSALTSEGTIGILCLIGAGLLLALLHSFVINGQKHFRSGMDEALLYYALILFISGIIISLETYDWLEELGHTILIFPILLVAAIFYLDSLLAVLAVGCFGLIIFFTALEWDPWGKILMPFMMMIYASALWFLINKLEKIKNYKIWGDNMAWVKWTAMLLLALSGNYFVVRELGGMLLESPMPEGEEIPLFWFFYIYTFAIPLIYIFLGLRNKNLGLLNIGLGLVAVAVFTIKYYHHVMPIEWTLVIGGLAMVLVAYIALKYWKTDKHGISVKVETHQRGDGLRLESIIIQQTLGKSEDPEKLMGGGKFGGGGTGGNF